MDDLYAEFVGEPKEVAQQVANDKDDPFFDDFVNRDVDTTQQELDFLTQNRDDETLRLAYGQAITKNADRMAEVYQFPEAEMLGAEAIEKRLGELQAIKKANEFDIESIKTDNPALYRFFQSRKNLDISHDDVGSLQKFENALKGSAGRTNTLIGNLNIASAKIHRAIGEITGSNPGSGIDEYIDVNKQALLESGAEYWQVDPEVSFTWEKLKGDVSVNNLTGFIIEQGGASIPDMAAVIANLPAYIMSRSEEITMERVANDNREEGTVEDYAIGTSGAVVVSLLERIGARGVLPTGTADSVKSAFKEVSKAVGKEGLTEFIQEQIEYATETVGTETGFDFKTSVIDRGLPGAIAGGGVGGGIRTPTAIAEVVQNRPAQLVEERTQEVEQKYNDEQAQIDEIIELSQDLKLPQRSKEATKEFIEGIDEQKGAESNVYVDANIIQELLQSSDLDENNEAFQALATQIPDAISNNSDVMIPMTDFMSDIVPNIDIAALRPHIRLKPDSLSQAEAEVAQTVREQTVQQLIDSANENIEERQKSEEIWKDVSDQLVATGRMNEKTARIQASLIPAYITQKAKQYGESVQQVYERFGLKIQRDEEIEQPNIGGVLLGQDFGDLEITEEVEVEETGEIVQVTQSAQKVWDRTVKKRDMAQKLRDCLNG